MYYSVIGILAIMILLIENHDILLNRSLDTDMPAWKVYRKFLFAVLVYYVTDVLWGFIEAKKLSRLLFIDTSVYYVSVAVGILFWSRYVVTYLNEDNLFGRFFIRAGQILACLIVVLVVVNIFAPVLFVVNEASEYKALAVRHILISLQILLLLLLSVYAVSSIIRKDNPYKIERRYRTIALFGIIMADFLFIQLWFPYLPLYAIGYMLGTCLLHSFVIGDEREEYRSELREIEKIAALKQSISSLLDNMPALSFSKDAETGVYLACNQAFAEYAHKESPEGVIGLTDAQIFDSETARHFVEDDRITLSMDQPYIFYEDVPDAVGNPRQFQTTKLKFRDGEGRLCLLGMCQDVTERRAAERLREEQKVYSRLNALSGEFLCAYAVIPESGRYREFSASEGFERFNIPKEGNDFFGTSRERVGKFIPPEDLEGFLSTFTKENIMAKIEKNGIFAMNYRLLIDLDVRYVQMKAVVVEESSGKRLIVGINDIDALVRQEEKYEKRLERAQEKANIDALTGVKTKYAYDTEEDKLNRQIKKHSNPEFAIVILDINDLKLINDTEGHQAGDQYIRNACRIICNIFKHSPVFRVGGDEFAVIARGEDYKHIDGLVGMLSKHNEKAQTDGDVVIACGMSKYTMDEDVASVYERADRNMYENKRLIKGQRQQK